MLIHFSLLFTCMRVSTSFLPMTPDLSSMFVQDINAASFLVPAWLDPPRCAYVDRKKITLQHPEREKLNRPEPEELRVMVMNSILEIDAFLVAASIKFPFGGVSRLLVRFQTVWICKRTGLFRAE